MKYFCFLFVLFIPALAFTQEFCKYFVTDIKYSGDKAPDLRIEFFENAGKNVLAITPSKKGNPFVLNPETHIEIYLGNRTKVKINVLDLGLDYVQDTAGQTFLVYTYSPTQIESIQLKSGIVGLIYIEPFPGDIIGYNPIGDC